MSPPRHRCKDCGITDDEGAHISKRGLCTECAAQRHAANTAAMKGIPVAQVPNGFADWLNGVARAGRPPTPYDPAA